MLNKAAKRLVSEGLGWYGMAAILTAYALVTFGVISADHLVYQGLNITGALGIALISLRKKAHQPGVLNIIWAVIAAMGMLISG